MKKAICVNGFNCSSSSDMGTDYKLIQEFRHISSFFKQDETLQRDEINRTTMFYEVVKGFQPRDDIKYEFYRGTIWWKGKKLKDRLHKSIKASLVRGEDIYIFSKSIGAMAVLKVLKKLSRKYSLLRVKLVTIDAEDIGSDRAWKYDNIPVKSWLNFYQKNETLGGNTFLGALNLRVGDMDTTHKNIEETMCKEKRWKLIFNMFQGE